MGKVLPSNEYPVRDIPLDAPDLPHPVPDREAAADPVDPDLAAVSRDVGARGRNRVVHFRGIEDKRAG